MIGPGMVAVIRVMAPRLKRFIPEVGPVKIDQPRDRAGSFKSCLLPPSQRRLAGLDGIKHVLGIWVQAAEGAKFWAGVCAELANRGVKDVLIVACDGLTGFPEAIAAALRPIYTAVNEDSALEALDVFEKSQWGQKYPATLAAWQRAWDRFIPFLAFGPATRKAIYTTNSIESLNYQLRKIIKTRGHFPSDAAAVKLIWLAITNIEDKRARHRARLQLFQSKAQDTYSAIQGTLDTSDLDSN